MGDLERERSGITTEEDISVLLRALANEYRRAVVRVLDETHTPVPRTALATYVAKERFPLDTEDDFIRFQDKLLMKLHHIHFPQLSDAEIIDIENGIVTKGDTFGEAVSLLDEIRCTRIRKQERRVREPRDELYDRRDAYATAA